MTRSEQPTRIVVYLYQKYTADAKCENLMKIATYLDPGFKAKYANKRAEVLLKMHACNPPLSLPDTEAQTAVGVNADTARPPCKKRKLSDFFKATEPQTVVNDMNDMELEIELYERSHIVHNKDRRTGLVARQQNGISEHKQSCLKVLLCASDVGTFAASV